MDPLLREWLLQAVEQEPFAQRLGLRLKEMDEGYARVEMVFDPETMGNIYGMSHGGAIFSLIDEAFQIAGNSHGNIAVAMNVNITYIKAPERGARLSAEAKLVAMTRKTATYAITVTEEDEHTIAVCQATTYRLDKKPPLPEKSGGGSAE